LDLAIRCALAQSAEELRSQDDLLQSLRALVAGWRVDQITDALASAHDAAVLMIDTSIVRVHQHGSCIAGNSEQRMGRSRGGLTSKIHAVRGRFEEAAWATIPPKRNRKEQICFSPYLYRARNPVERFFNRDQAMSTCRHPL
jgi:hypothetical protein